MSNTTEDETTVNDSYSVTVPASVRDELGLEAGDRLRWRVTDDGELSVEIVERRRGAFSDLDPVEAEEPTDAAADHDAVAGDY
ncbi:MULTISPECIES: AbrB/MazE/SpoVT family DNA-binding domain-containing protein [Halomicrobium]|uniref:AbrB/MazE/SpoVT family DNA-binding domain-containing protein n=1 Tax=Halomicrobium mukohataei TaxID=57705 RepID=A0A847U8A7_9EURY|nr:MULTISPECIES: AbrB/MazE/SpoVT family DNA-binding domain-containing protein [Halomicrobium]MBO4248044.1 AbrB/MazE/SpoVT family DNA-binding domain-containing protein [Halomicrobium sp. IBSBa]NLV09575.1 AbrB/MazE/SpoVT family DNA-binding domain-containing protein [Halomicrobium mukohataei]QGA81526.1 AbrB family transcriptional regulator [Halomicrobium sp. LC1Hm]